MQAECKLAGRLTLDKAQETLDANPELSLERMGRPYPVENDPVCALGLMSLIALGRKEAERQAPTSAYEVHKATGIDNSYLQGLECGFEDWPELVGRSRRTPEYYLGLEDGMTLHEECAQC